MFPDCSRIRTDNEKKTDKAKHMWKLKNSLLNDHSKKFAREFGKDLELNKSKNMTHPNVCGVASAGVRETIYTCKW